MGTRNIQGVRPVREPAISADSTDQHSPASNTAAIVTKAASAVGKAWHLSGIYWSYDAAPTGGNIKIEDASGTTVFSLDITAAGPGFLPFVPPLAGTSNTALIGTLAAGGSGISGKLHLHVATEG